jgi:hypothetical protein
MVPPIETVHDFSGSHCAGQIIERGWVLEENSDAL